MNLQQLRIVDETIRRDFNLTEASLSLHTSQSGLSKRIKDLEEELGIEIFIRRGKRLIGLTEPGKELIPFAQRILRDVKNMKRIAQHFSSADAGPLVVATTHTQARYVLPPVVSEFRKAFPKVELVLLQCKPAEIAALLLSGGADIGIATEGLSDTSELIAFPYYDWHHAVIVPRGHPLENHHALTLGELAAFPIITYSEGITGRTRIDDAFAKAGLSPHVAIAALDTDVIKTYVELGLGVGIIAAMAFDPDRDHGLRLIPAAELFKPNTAYVAVRRGTYLRGFTCRFVTLCIPSATEDAIRAAIA